MANDPTLIAFARTRHRNGKHHWRRIGAAWPHDQGAGLTLHLDLIPSNWDGRLVLLEPDEADDAHILKLANQRAQQAR